MDKFKQLVDEFNNINNDIQSPDIGSNPKKLETLSKRLYQITPIVEQIKQLFAMQDNKAQAEAILKEESDTELKEMAQLEVDELSETIKSLTQEIEDKLKVSDPNDNRNVIVEIRAGTGGEEASLFASDLFRMYTRFAETMQWKVQVMHTSYTGTGGIKEIIFQIIGDNVYGMLKYENGVHRVQRVPATESSGRIHTSAASLVVLPEVDDIDIQINPGDLKIDVYRSSGPGGQSVNTTDSAVRITHIPTGIVVTCQDEKSQLKNKARAMSILKSKLYEIEEEKKNAEASDARKSAIKSGDRSVKIRTYNFPDGRVTDHRIKETWHNLSQILDGDIGEVIEATIKGLTKESD